MKLAIIGLPYTGKTTLFEALTGHAEDASKKMENRISTITVPDARVDKLSEMYTPKKTTYAHVEYFLPGAASSTETKGNEAYWAQVRSCDALIHVVRNFNLSGEAPDPEGDFKKIDEDMTFSDLVVADKRLEKIELEQKRGRGYDKEEHELLLKCKEMLENDTPLRRDPELAASPRLRGFTFLSAKPMMVVYNNDDENETVPAIDMINTQEKSIALRCRLEHEIAQMDSADAEEFLKEYHINQPATHRMIRESYDLLGLMSFFTVGDDEVKAWTIKKETEAVDAAEEIHSDIKKGFIRAEVVAYDDLMDAGTYAEARKHGTVRLEGKTYLVQDGDIINFRFNV